MDRVGGVLSSEGGKGTGGKWGGGGLQPSTTPSHCESTEQMGVGSPPQAGTARVVSEGHTSAAVAQHAGQDASVQLVELHQLQQICEPGLAVVHAEVEAALVFAW